MIGALVDGAAISSAYDAAVQALASKGQEHLVDKLTKTLGFGTGLELRESSALISAKSMGVVKAGMVFNVSIGENTRSRCQVGGCLTCNLCLQVRAAPNLEDYTVLMLCPTTCVCPCRRRV